MQLSEDKLKAPKSIRLRRKPKPREKLAPAVTTAGKAIIDVKERDIKALVNFYRPFMVSKAIQFVTHASADYDQAIILKQVKDKLQGIPSLFIATKEGVAFSDLGATVNEIAENLTMEYSTKRKKVFTPEEIGEGKGNLPLRTFLGKVRSLFRKRKMGAGVYLDIVNAIKDIASQPRIISSNLKRAQGDMVKAAKIYKGEYKYPTGHHVVKDQASIVSSIYNDLDTPINQVKQDYARMKRQKARWSEQQIIDNMASKMRKLDISAKRTDFREERPEGTVRIETEQLQAGSRFLAAIHMYHTHRKIPIVYTDLIDKYMASWRFTDVQKSIIKSVVNKVANDFHAKVREGRKGKAKLYERYRDDPVIIPMKDVRDALLETNMVHKAFKKFEKKQELLYILNKETDALMSQVHKRWPIKAPSSLDGNVSWFIFGDGVRRFFKTKKRLTGKERQKIKREERKRQVDLQAAEARKLETRFEAWIKDFKANRSKILKEYDDSIKEMKDEVVILKEKASKQEKLKEEVAESLKVKIKSLTMLIKSKKKRRKELTERGLDDIVEEERRIQIDLPFERYQNDSHYETEQRIATRLEVERIEKISKSQVTKIKDEDLERNAVELSRRWASARARDMQGMGHIKWRQVRGTNLTGAVPFIVNAYMRDNRLKQLELLDSAISELEGKRFDEDRELLQDLKRKRRRFASLSTYVQKKKELDGIWKRYSAMVYAPKRFKPILINFKKKLEGRSEDQKQIEIMIDWIDAKPKEKITIDDMALPKVDVGSAMEYPLAREKLYDGLKKFRDEEVEENEAIRKLSASISADVIDASAIATMGGARNEHGRMIKKLRNRYNRKRAEALALHPEKSDKMSRLYRLRYEDNYFSPKYGSDAFGILSLMESGMLKVNKKPSDYVAEYLAMGRMLDPVSTFPATSDEQSLDSYKVIPSLNEIQFEIENVHAYPSISEWADSLGLNRVTELADDRTISGYLADAAMRSVDVGREKDTYEEYELGAIRAKEDLQEFGSVILKEYQGKWMLKPLFKAEEKKIKEKGKVIRTVISMPILNALIKKMKRRKMTSEEETMIEDLNKELLKAGFDKKAFPKVRGRLRTILLYMIGSEKEFLESYAVWTRKEEEKRMRREEFRVGRLNVRAMRRAVPELGPYLNDALEVISRHFGEVPEEEVFSRLAQIQNRIITKPKDERTEENLADLKRIRKIFAGITNVKQFRVLGRILGKPELADAFVSTLKIRAMGKERLMQDIRRVKRQRGALIGKLVKAEEMSKEEAIDFARAEISRQVFASDLFDEDSSYQTFGIINEYLIGLLQQIEFLEDIRSDSDLFYGGFLLEIMEKRLKRTRPELDAEQRTAEAERLLKEVKISGPNIRETPADRYLDACEALKETMSIRQDELEILAQVIKREPAEIEVASGFRSRKALAACSKIDDTKLLIAETHKDRRLRAKARARKRFAEKKIMTFLGTPHMMAHKKTSRKSAEAFFGIDELLAEKQIGL